ncbi:MAG: helix-turn-helix transcriptional regulator [Erysipelotrichaceae bacterium]|nr:helix-turn-helix transcriptional regulator [Erysipelotrichaceae bacterium]
MEDLEYGTIKIHLDELMKERNISLNKLSFRAEMQRTQLRKYRDNTVQRLDVAVLARLCFALNCNLNDLIEYVPPQK